MSDELELRLVWRGVHLDHGELPPETGIYAVWALVLDRDEDIEAARLLWIGETDGEDGIRGRLGGHERWPDWKAALVVDESIGFTYVTHGNLDDQDVRRAVECTLIGAYAPDVNVACNDGDEYCYSFSLDITHRGATLGVFEGMDSADACE